jgi:hypothetical protein
MSNPVKTYFNSTHNLLYSYILAIPLLLLYEVLILISQPDSAYVVRISVDVWFKSLFNLFGLNALSFTLILAALFGIWILYRERAQLKEIRWKYFPILLAEASVLAVIISFISQTMVGLILGMDAQGDPNSFNYIQKLALSLGAGLYEELFFRVILVSLLVYLFKFIFTKKWAVNASAILLAAALFSAIHYVGSYGDAFTLGSFLYRFIFGLFLNGVYLSRGFGVAAWTHAIYDVLVISIY